jgi:hypothetical protein
MEVPLIAGVDVDQLGYFARIKAALAYLVWGGKKR